jgi:adenylylsulfate kinase-like enzyme
MFVHEQLLLTATTSIMFLRLQHGVKSAAMQSRLLVLTGASGGGKTTLARALEATRPENVDVLFFDSLGYRP